MCSVPEASILLAHTLRLFRTEELSSGYAITAIARVFATHCSCSCYQLNANASTCACVVQAYDVQVVHTPHAISFCLGCVFVAHVLVCARLPISILASLRSAVSKCVWFYCRHGRHFHSVNTHTHIYTHIRYVRWCFDAATSGEPLLALPKCQRTRDRIVCTAVVTSLHTPNTHSQIGPQQFLLIPV